MKKYILMVIASMMLVSCLDTIILPDDKTVDEDFWKTKEDVASMVNAAYAAMTTEDVISRIILWGSYRSDEITRSTSFVGAGPDALDEITSVNIQTTNMYATWAAFYAVINKCNIVLERAPGVMEEDPNYAEGNYKVDRAQMLALRSLCYFYLVRTFRDVPYITTAYMNSSQDMAITQSAPETVLTNCIADLEDAMTYGLDARSYNLDDWRRVGWFTNDGIRMLAADIYLWLASIHHNPTYYQRCADLCFQVIESKKAQHKTGRGETAKDYPLPDADKAYDELFVSQNAEESILELQSKNNPGLCHWYYKYKDNNSTEGYLRGTLIFATASTMNTNVSASQVFYSGDLRYYAATYKNSKSTDNVFHIRKMVGQTSVTDKTTEERSNTRTHDNYGQNLIIYRLSDAMLMRAEALTQLYDEDATPTDPIKRVAFEMVRQVNMNSLFTLTDSLKWGTYQNVNREDMEKLVMEERLREFCFEGKRWYDLLRYNYRHITETVDYNRTLGQQLAEDGAYRGIKNYNGMLELMTRASENDAKGIMAKMVSEAYLYLPIPNSDIIANPLLKQNPVYTNNNEYNKNY